MQKAFLVFGDERRSLAQRSVFNHKGNGEKKPKQNKKSPATKVFSHQSVLCDSQMNLVM